MFIFLIEFLACGFCHRLIAVGEEFCGSTSEDLHDSIRTQTVKYFKTYHRSRMDELRMFLENDAWELCPVKASFKIVDLSVSTNSWTHVYTGLGRFSLKKLPENSLQEFRFMKYQHPLVKTHKRTGSGTVQVTTETGVYTCN